MTKKNRDRRKLDRYWKRTCNGKRPVYFNRRKALAVWCESEKYYGWITGDTSDSPFSDVVGSVSFKLSLPNPFTEV